MWPTIASDLPLPVPGTRATVEPTVSYVTSAKADAASRKTAAGACSYPEGPAAVSSLCSVSGIPMATEQCIGERSPWKQPRLSRNLQGMSIVLCGVDDTEAGTSVMAAAKAAAERAGAAVLLTSGPAGHWGANVRAFHADTDETRRVIEYGPPADRIL